MIQHLKGREKALEPFGLTGRRAECVALVSLHGGVCLRRIAEMRELLRSARPECMIDAHSVWRSSRLAGVRI